MSDRAVISLQEYRETHGIELLASQPWPASRGKDFRVAEREHTERQLRVTVCGFCGSESPLLDGPTGRAWFASHSCEVSAA